MDNMIWINQRQPQTLYMAQILMYIRGGMAILFGALLNLGTATLFGSRLIALVWILLLTVGMVAGAFGVANEKRWGYRLAVTAAIAPLLIRVVNLVDSGVASALADPITLMFDAALLALLLHTLSSEYQKVWFR